MGTKSATLIIVPLFFVVPLAGCTVIPELMVGNIPGMNLQLTPGSERKTAKQQYQGCLADGSSEGMGVDCSDTQSQRPSIFT